MSGRQKTDSSLVCGDPRFARDSVVLITGLDSLGTIITCNGVILSDFKILCLSSVVYDQHVIFCDINNVNGVGKSFRYILKVISVDYSGNLAYLDIDYANIYNKGNPVLVQHKFIKIGKSKNIQDGETVYILGSITNGTRFITDTLCIPTVILSKEWSSIDGGVTNEMMILNCYLSMNGAIVVNGSGYLIGIQIALGDIVFAAITEYSMRLPLSSFRSGKPHTKSMIGIECRLCPIDMYVCYSSEIPHGKSIDTSTLNIPHEISGYIVDNVIAESSFYGKLQPGDVLTHINDTPLGIKEYQSRITRKLWRAPPGTPLKITYRRGHTINFLTETTIAYTDTYDIPYMPYIPYSDRAIVI